MDRLRVSPAPHVFSKSTTQNIMLDVIIALVPASLGGVYFFGARALLTIIVSIAAAVLAEFAYQRITKKQVTVGDLSAVVTGLLLALNVPPTVPLWLPAVGSAFAIIIVKQLFGGLGHNFMNPALAARAVLMASWAGRMTAFVDPKNLDFNTLMSGADIVSSATPLSQMKYGMPATYTLWDLFMGNVGGCIGETSVLLLLIGAAYLMLRKVIIPITPIVYIATVALLTWVLGGKGALFTGDPVPYLFAGGLVLGAFFMATDYSSTPVTPMGHLIFGVGCGIFTTVIRLYGSYPEGVSYSILLMNVATPLIDRFTKPRVFGKEVVKRA